MRRGPRADKPTDKTYPVALSEAQQDAILAAQVQVGRVRVPVGEAKAAWARRMRMRQWLRHSLGVQLWTPFGYR